MNNHLTAWNYYAIAWFIVAFTASISIGWGQFLAWYLLIWELSLIAAKATIRLIDEFNNLG